ncbi:hypothetical protein HK102_012560 [Quaeritorhiza haematococci]|nr:hypothetical protein HK102_012560 [Quaeritorhiza haematococci]
MMKELKAAGGLLLGLALTGRAPAAAAPAVAPLDDAACWQALPAIKSGGGGPLPSWAKAVAVRLPRTAAAMLELDHAQRTKSPLDPKLRAAMRWVVAHNNRCAYSEAYALADARCAGMDEATIKAVVGDPEGGPAEYRAARAFARRPPGAGVLGRDARM